MTGSRWSGHCYVSAVGGAFAALDDVSVSLNLSLSVIMGNGAGKSTLAGAIAGNVALSAGRIRLGDGDITRMASTAGRVHLPGRPGPTMGRAISRRGDWPGAEPRTWRSLLRLALRTSVCRDFRGATPALRSRPWTQAQRSGKRSVGRTAPGVALAWRCCGRQLLVLDEHTSALDPEMGARVDAANQASGVRARLTTLMITHNSSTPSSAATGGS